MFRSKSTRVKGTTSFLSNFEEFWKYFDVQRNKLEGYKSNSCPRTTEITRSYFTAFDEELCFVDTPESMISFQLRNLNETLIDLKVIDAILVFANEYLEHLELYIQQFFTATNYPREKIIFMISNDNTVVTIVYLEKKLKEWNMTTKILPNKNLFLMKDLFSASGMLTFCNSLKLLFTLQPCVSAFTDIPNLFKVIPDMFPALIEILDNINESTIKFLRYGKTRIICKRCGVGPDDICNHNCKCLDELKSVKLTDCCLFSVETCGKCSCPFSQHLVFKSANGEKRCYIEKALEPEKTTILHTLASFYLFCEQGPGLHDVFRNLKKENHRLLSIIQEMESNSYRPTPEEVRFLLESLEKEEWKSFQMKNFIEPTCELKLITNPNLPATSSQASTSKANQPTSQKPLRFPEMKTTHNAQGAAKKESVEDLKEIVDNLRKEFDELKLSMQEQKNNKK